MRQSHFNTAALAMAAASFVMMDPQPRWRGFPERDDNDLQLIPTFREEIVFPPSADELAAQERRRKDREEEDLLQEEKARLDAIRIEAAKAKRARRAAKRMKGSAT